MQHSPPSCSLSQCFANFTQMERVQDVECRNCTLLKEIQEMEDEVMMLEGAVLSFERKHTKTKDANAKANHPLAVDLQIAQDRLKLLRSIDPDGSEEIPIIDESALLSAEALQESSSSKSPSPHCVPLLRGDALKCLMLTRLPTVLVLHIQRRYYDVHQDRMMKSRQHVDFPQMLDVREYCAYSSYCNDHNQNSKRRHHQFLGQTTATPKTTGTKQYTPQVGNRSPSDETTAIGRSNVGDNDGGDDNTSSPHNTAQMSSPPLTPIPYRLQAVIEHRGNAYSGHYVAYRRCPSTGVWHMISDDTIVQKSWAEVANCQAYMLFYEAEQ